MHKNMMIGLEITKAVFYLLILTIVFYNVYFSFIGPWGFTLRNITLTLAFMLFYTFFVLFGIILSLICATILYVKPKFRIFNLVSFFIETTLILMFMLVNLVVLGNNVIINLLVFPLFVNFFNFYLHNLTFSKESHIKK